MKDTNCSSSLSDIVTIVENDSQLASHYMTGNENFNLAEKEKSEFNYDTMGTKRLEGNESIYDESDGVYRPQNSQYSILGFNFFSL